MNAPVRVTASILQGKRGYKWVFRAAVRNAETGSSWIEVYGGTKQHEGLRSFRESEVELIPEKKKRKRNA